MIESPLISVCIPTFNVEKTIGRTLDSILVQTYKNLEIIIVDNQSTDRTLEIVSSYDDKRIKIHKNEINLGAEGNFQKAMYLANGKYTGIFHADDEYLPDMISKQAVLLEKRQDVGAVFVRAIIIDEKSNIIKKTKTLEKLGLGDKDYAELDLKLLFKTVLRKGNFLMCPSALVRTEIYQNDIKEWRAELFASSSDLDVWLRIAEKKLIVVLNEPLLRYRKSQHHFSYHYHHQRIVKADFIKVLEFWLNHDLMLLTLTDQKWYQEQLRRDLILRAMIALVTGDSDTVKKLMQTKEWNWRFSCYAGMTSMKFIILYALIIVARVPFTKKIFRPFLKRFLAYCY